MASDVAVISLSSNSVLNGNIVTQVPRAAASAFKTNNVDTGATDVRGHAATDVELDANYSTRFDSPRFYTGDSDTDT